ncbi:hypothetical protein NB689_000244 [Xanthomonas sacchari]|nr:hypothetical protein [Xanthomonas sacchari]MCW0414490.1 hypothetical protein [Xanthomonas sacchari]MCW0436248.1 hypothetical protein [Xanthomonas sacchari]
MRVRRESDSWSLVAGEGAASSVSRCLGAPGFARTLIRPLGPPSPDGRRNSLFLPLVFGGDPRPFRGSFLIATDACSPGATWGSDTLALPSSPSPTGRGVGGEGPARKRLAEFGGEGPARKRPAEFGCTRLRVPSSGPSGHLLTSGEGTASAFRVGGWARGRRVARSIVRAAPPPSCPQRLWIDPAQACGQTGQVAEMAARFCRLAKISSVPVALLHSRCG